MRNEALSSFRITLLFINKIVVKDSELQMRRGVQSHATYLFSHQAGSTPRIEYGRKSWQVLSATKSSIKTSTKPSVSIISQLLNKRVLETVNIAVIRKIVDG